jgi:hypothetical protein
VGFPIPVIRVSRAGCRMMNWRAMPG